MSVSANLNIKEKNIYTIAGQSAGTTVSAM